MQRILCFSLIAGLLSACMPPSGIQVAGGNKANGQVVLSYDYNVMQKPVVDVQQGLSTAASQCQGWGYVGAIPSGKLSTTCSTKTQNGDCIAWKVTTRFQCTGVVQ